MPDEARDRQNVAWKYRVTVGVLDRPKKNLYNQNSACLISFMTGLMNLTELAATKVMTAYSY